jgi:ATP-dependent Clp protease ATP-binding subunit ClpB
VEDTISILRGLKERYEVHHGVRITDGAVIAAATLSNRYITDRFLPDKAIDLIDEAASRLRMQIDSKPQALDELDRQVMQLEIEREALKKEKDDASKQRLAELEKELADLKEQSAELTGRWQAERDAIAQVQVRREAIDQVRVAIEQAERAYDLQKAAELRYGKLRQLESELAQAQAQVRQLQAEGRAAQGRGGQRGDRRGGEQVDGRPVSKLLEGEREKLVRMEGHLHERVSARRRRCTRWPQPSAAAAPACKTRTGPSAASSSWGRRASARPNWRGRWPSSSSTTSRRWCAST